MRKQYLSQNLELWIMLGDALFIAMVDEFQQV